ncbi:MAG: hypothetical protein H6726_06140 [Sandaracinaceae bacterium]|nr:hypothetical protein [Sandaracinaceae bacterium]
MSGRGGVAPESPQPQEAPAKSASPSHVDQTFVVRSITVALVYQKCTTHR